MTKPVSVNSALVPRRPQKPRDEEWSESRAEEPVFTGYAPPGAQWKARVRHLGEEAARPVAPASEEKVSPRGGVTVERNGKEGLTLKIQAEVTVLGALPKEGIAIETVTLVKGSPNGRGGFMTVESTQNDTQGLVSLAEQQVDDAVRRTSVFAKVSIQLQLLKAQISTLGVGADVVRHTLGDEDDDDENGNRLATLGRSLDQYL